MKINENINCIKNFSLQKEFLEYMKQSYNKTIPLNVFTHEQRGFYAGAIVLLYHLTNSIKHCTKEEHIKLLKKIKNEIHDFFNN